MAAAWRCSFPSPVSMTFAHSNSHNGNEEWLFTDRGTTTPIKLFDPIDPIFGPGVNGIAELSTFVLGLLGAGLMALRRRA